MTQVYYLQTGVQFSDGKLTQENMCEWLKQDIPSRNPISNSSTATLRVVICVASERLISKIPIFTKSVWETLALEWQIPLEFRQRFADDLPFSTTFEQRDAKRDDAIYGKFIPDFQGFMARTDSSRDQEFGMVLLHHPTHLITHAVILLLCISNAESFIPKIKSLTSFPKCPLTIPFLLLEGRADELVKAINNGRRVLTDIHFTIGMHEPGEHPDSAAYKDSDGEPDLNKITQNLTCLAQDFTELRCRIEFLLQFCMVSRIWHKRCESPCTERQEMDTGSSVCQSEFSLLNDRLLGFQSQIACSIKETQSQVQTTYSLLSQRDNYLNLCMAQLMARDSFDMRIITWITLIFFPATFVAALFGSSLFRFSPEKPKVVSSWIWLYWTLVAVVFVIVITLWQTCVRLRMRKPLVPRSTRSTVPYTEGRSPEAETWNSSEQMII